MLNWRKTMMAEVLLNSGLRIPSIGLGTFQMRSLPGHDIICQTLDVALGCGYRLIDTAAVYRNEADIGKCLHQLYAKYGLTRQDVFITSKLAPRDHGLEAAKQACLKSLKDLDCGYLDMYLIHWPGVQKLKSDDPRNAHLRAESWKSLENLHHSGIVKSIGVSNYTIDHLEELLQFATVVPALLQVEFHPLLYQKELLEFCKRKGIMLQAYTSLGQGKLLSEPVVTELANRYGAAPAQVLLKWAWNHGVGVIPKSTNPDHIRSNMELCNIDITEVDMTRLDSMNTNTHFCWDSTRVV